MEETMAVDEIAKHVYTVIMAGGGGERFWPMSRQARPKQLLSIFGKKTMIQQTAERIAPLAGGERLLVITNEIQAPLIREQLPEVPSSSIVAEPFGRDTAACIALGAAMVAARDPEGTMIVLPADHVIRQSEKLIRNLTDACALAREEGCLVTLGIRPTEPSTGYGYIKRGEEIPFEGRTAFARVAEFMEKPDRETAERYLESGRYFWNSGMFVWTVQAIVEEIRRQMPKLYEGYLRISEGLTSPEREAIIREVYSGLEKISIDYGIMEHAESVAVAVADFDWDDAGSWCAVERHYPRDESGNVTIGDAVALDTEDSIIVSESGIVGCIGLKDLIVVKTPDAVLVCRRDRAQDVKKIVRALKERAEWQRYT